MSARCAPGESLAGQRSQISASVAGSLSGVSKLLLSDFNSLWWIASRRGNSPSSYLLQGSACSPISRICPIRSGLRGQMRRTSVAGDSSTGSHMDQTTRRCSSSSRDLNPKRSIAAIPRLSISSEATDICLSGTANCASTSDISCVSRPEFSVCVIVSSPVKQTLLK